MTLNFNLPLSANTDPYIILMAAKLHGMNLYRYAFNATSGKRQWLYLASNETPPEWVRWDGRVMTDEIKHFNLN